MEVQSLQVEGVLVLDGQAVLPAHGSEDVHLRPLQTTQTFH